MCRRCPDTILLGQGVSFGARGERSVDGVYGGLGFDWRLSERVRAYAAVEGTVLSDQSWNVTGRGGVEARY